MTLHGVVVENKCREAVLSVGEVDARWAEIVAALTRRGFLTGTAATSLLTLAACSQTPDIAEQTDETVRANTPYGEVEVPRSPKRLVILEGRQDLEVALALGLPKPVGVGENALDSDGRSAPYVSLDPSGVAVIAAGETNLEEVAALQPDLIIGRAMNIEPIAEQLARIAPVLPVEVDGTAWRDELSQVGAWTGREKQAADALAGYDQELAAFRAKHGGAVGSAVGAVMQPWLQDGLWYSSRSNGFLLQNRVHADLGGVALTSIEDSAPEDDTSLLEFSSERFDLLREADMIIAIVNSDEEKEALAAQSLWSQLPAVVAGRVVHTDFRTSTGSVLAATACLALWDEAYSLL